jgi:hypothetical protein
MASAAAGNRISGMRVADRVLWIAVFFIVTPLFAAKKILILDFRSIDHDPNFQYLEVSLTESVRKYLHEKYEIVESDPGDVARQMSDAAFVFVEDFHNKNVALQLGLLTGQDVVLSGGFRQKMTEHGSTVISLEVFIIDVENRTLVKRIIGEVRVDSNLFHSIDKFSARIVQEAKGVLPNKGEYDFDQYTPVRMTQLSVLGGYNMNALSNGLRKNSSLSRRPGIVPADLGGFVASVELRRDRFLKINRLIGYGRADAQIINTEFSVANESSGLVARGFGGTLEAGLGYQFFRYKRFFAQTTIGGGFNYTAFKMDFSTLKNQPINTESRESLTQSSGNFFGPIASTGLRLGFQINRSFSWELGAAYQMTFLSGSTSGNLMATMGLGVRL